MTKRVTKHDGEVIELIGGDDHYVRGHMPPIPPQPTPPAAAPTDADLLKVGYAPGGYSNSCVFCGRNASPVDKRCFTCRECAVQRWLQVERDTKPTAPAEKQPCGCHIYEHCAKCQPAPPAPTSQEKEKET